MLRNTSHRCSVFTGFKTILYAYLTIIFRINVCMLYHSRKNMCYVRLFSKQKTDRAFCIMFTVRKEINCRQYVLSTCGFTSGFQICDHLMSCLCYTFSNMYDNYRTVLTTLARMILFKKRRIFCFSRIKPSLKVAILSKITSLVEMFSVKMIHKIEPSR